MSIGCVFVVLLTVGSGCADRDSTDDQVIVESNPPVYVQEGDQVPVSDDSLDDDQQVAEPSHENPLVDGVRKLLDSSPVFKENEDLRDGLADADRTLSEIREENLAALRDASRPIILEPRPPNIVLLVADDLGYGDLGCYGQKRIKTPALDQLAEQGARFTQFYAGGTTSEQSLWCLMTGRYTARMPRPDRTSSSKLSPQLQTLPEVLWRAGFETGFVGNWQLHRHDADSPHLHGFDSSLATRSGDQFEPYPQHVWSNGAKARIIANAGDKSGVLVHDLVVQEAISFLDKHRSGRPFFLLVQFALPRGSAEIPEHPDANVDWSEDQNAYASSVHRVDSDVSNILGAIDRLELQSKTLVCFTSDNATGRRGEVVSGFFDSQGGLRGVDGQLYEGAIRVPFIVRWPGQIPERTVADYAASIWDLLPTFAEMGRVQGRVPSTDGVSLVPVFRGKAGLPRERLYWESHTGGFAQAVRMGAWKAVRPADRTQVEDIELYNLAEDPLEQHDVSAKYPEILAKTLQQGSTETR